MTSAPAIDRAFAAVSGPLAAAGVECLLIGGFAVNHYGYSRSTLDVDFMVVADRLDDLRRIMVGEGFANVVVEDNVVFFSAPESSLRVDFLRVDSETMRALLDRSLWIEFHGHRIRVPALMDLLAMKLFALAHAADRRADKDLPDIVALCRIHKLDIEKDMLPLCMKHATRNIFEQVAARVKAIEAC